MIDRVSIFRVDHKGTIHNLQLLNMMDRIDRLEDAVSTVIDNFNRLKDYLEDIIRAGHIEIAHIPSDQWSINDINI